MANNPDWKARSIEALNQYHPALCATIERLNAASVTLRVMAVHKDTLRIVNISSHVRNIIGGPRGGDPWDMLAEGVRSIQDLRDVLREATGNTAIEVYSP